MTNYKNLELAANIWPIVDETSGLIQRVAARAYAFPEGDDSLISSTMLKLAPTDWVVAKQFPIPPKMKFVTEHGTLQGSVTSESFNRYIEYIVDPILEDLEKSMPKIVGVSMANGLPEGVAPEASFAESPYTTITFLLEDLQGNLTPQL